MVRHSCFGLACVMLIVLSGAQATAQSAAAAAAVKASPALVGALYLFRPFLVVTDSAIRATVRTASSNSWSKISVLKVT